MGPAPAPRPVPRCPVRGLELLPPPQNLRVQVFPVVVDVILYHSHPSFIIPSQVLADRYPADPPLPNDPHTFTPNIHVSAIQTPRLCHGDWVAYLDIVIDGNGDDVRCGGLLGGGVELRDVGVPQGLLCGDALGRVELQQLGQQVRGRGARCGKQAVQVPALAPGQALQHLLSKVGADGLHILLGGPPCMDKKHRLSLIPHELLSGLNYSFQA